MRTILSLAALLFCSVAFAQSSEFTSIENKIKDYISKGQWDEVILLAPDLMIEEPTRGEGYYYTAVGFYRLGQFDKANEYMGKAEGLADEALKGKLVALKLAISTGKQAVQIEK